MARHIGYAQQHGEGLWHLLDWDFTNDLPNLDIYINTRGELFVFPQEKNGTEKVEFFVAGGKPWWPGLVEHCKVRQGKSMRKKGRDDYIATIQDAKEALDVCAHPEYEGTHGLFNAPASLTGREFGEPERTDHDTKNNFDGYGREWAEWEILQIVKE
ncbi:uncharacterized protein DFL_005870 [Arthrobotrys flagrans]|uniref:Uncharacterized protein n=1 Tax=Arthrobotrys flagrans TaxID=97331 RepID=A0A436ZZ97_ARTFL|nr:hypothetical protein DFL_005870 [Arthrobotrys flagrans]